MKCRRCNKELFKEEGDDLDEGICRKCKELELDDLACNIIYSPFNPGL